MRSQRTGAIGRHSERRTCASAVLGAFRIFFDSALDVGYVLAAKRCHVGARPAASRSPALGENDLHPFGGYDTTLNYSHYVRPFVCPFQS
jgi:hypothetical protein